ncbi:MAG TPA: rhamnogalacturonan lyase [Pyrinomonadaceae bacterium]|jgi:rhamnogalacturonan endolyase
MRASGFKVGLTVTLALLFLFATEAEAQRQMERLGRGVIAVNQGDGKVFVGWRMLGTDSEAIAFNLYRSTGGGEPVKLNEQPLTDVTNFVDAKADLTKTNSYFVRPVSNRLEQEASKAFTLPANASTAQYLTIPLQAPQGYMPNDASAGDLDGDGEYEIIIHMAGRGRDNASPGLTDPPVFQAYRLDGTLLWTINLGKNIREGAHYTQFMVYDLDGDGRAEFACKTADGTVDGKGAIIGDGKADWRFLSPVTDRRYGKILDGPEYLTIFDGGTGAALATTAYIPPRGNLCGWGGIGGNGQNDCTGNRVDRFTAAVAYLDGHRPSLVMCRGYYGRTVLAAWDWRDGKLTSRWVFDTNKGYPKYAGMGNHNLSVADVDGDGRDEIIFGSMCVDDNGRGLYSTGLRHGDALHVGDLDPARPGLEVYGVHEIEENTKGPGTALYDARTGRILWTGDQDRDVGRGLAADIDPRHLGDEMWGGSEGLKNARGEKIGPAPRSINFAIWWDGDLLREILNGNRISKWDWQNSRLETIFTADGCMSNNGTKSTPALSADLLGDWREEVIFRTVDNQSLRVYTTTIPTRYRFHTLMHDPQYRLSIAWQNVGYNQPPHTGFYLGDGMKPPPRPSITTQVRAASRR